MFGLAAWSGIDPEAIKRWFQNSPQVQQQMLQQSPPLSANLEASFVEFRHCTDEQYQTGVLARYVATLPALPEEGY